MHGDWAIRIDGGGEIYSATLSLKAGDEGEPSVVGKYSSDGRRGRVTDVRRDKEFFVVEVATRRSGMPASGAFAFELIADRMVGDVDFEYGSSARSYEFEATRINDGGNAAMETTATRAADMPVSVATAANATAANEVKVDRSSVTVVFQNGSEGYEGAVDTEIWGIAPTKPLDRQGTMTADSNNGGAESQVLMRFDEVFGDDEERAPLGSRIVSATLQVVVFDPGSTVYLHQVLVPWHAWATWDAMAYGVSVDDIEASTVRDGFSFGEITMDRQTVEFDVTQTVQKWADGQPNYGWLFINTGGNGWDFYSSDWIEQELRPTLRIEYALR
ncbi:MAG: DNRLRE domain-containing protein [Planctomycetota bacterium]